MKVFLTLLFSLLVSLSYGQKYCGFDQLRQIQGKHNSVQEHEMNDLILERSLQMMSSQAGGEEFTIPVVVHIVHQNGDENISDELVLTGVDHLNQAFSNSGTFFDAQGVETGISFCLAQTDPDGNLTDGINRVESALTDLEVPSEELELKDLIRWNPEEYLNIWLVAEITREVGNEGTIGFSSFPEDHGEDNDGIVCEAAFFGSTEESSGVHIHEVGHYLGLYHTFHDGCPNQDCQTEGDRVCDTPPDQHVFNSICFDGTNSCSTDEDDESDNNPFRPEGLGGLGDQVDMQDNYMDYSSLICFSRFTFGQSARMQATIVELRSSLLENNWCAPPCDSFITASITSNEDSFSVGDAVSFTNNSSNFTSIEWFVNGEFFSDENAPDFNFEEVGIYEFEAVMNNGSEACEEVVVFAFDVSCPIEPEFAVESTVFSEGETVFFENETVGGETFGWYVDGEVVSNSIDFEYDFDQPGGYTVVLAASNGDCISESEPLYISIGFCTSGNENNLWYFFNPVGSIFGFDFNEGADFTMNSTELDEDGHCKSSICDISGNLLFVSTGEHVLDQNFEIMPNGDDMAGEISSHFGTLFMQVPGSETLYYVFNSSAFESNYEGGITYSIIDRELNGGLGDVTDTKNVFIEESGTESFSTIRHCNLEDFWLVFYDADEAVYKSYLVTADGIDDTPVVSEYNQTGNFLYRTDLRASAQGNKVIHYNMLFDFDQATGSFDLVHDFAFDGVLAHEFSPNGKVLYMETGQTDVVLRQFNLDLEIDDMLDSQYIIDLDDLGDVGTDMALGPDGRIYKEKLVTGTISTIELPNLIGEAMSYDDDDYSTGALINTFGNYHHAYLHGTNLEISGPDTMCIGTADTFEILNAQCLVGPISWSSSSGEIVEQDNGIISLEYAEVGDYVLHAEMPTACGLLEADLSIYVRELPEPDLGPDMAVCDGISLILSVDDSYEDVLWSTDQTSNSILVDQAGTVWVEVTENGCVGSDEIEIGPVITPVINLGADQELCDSDILILSISEFWVDPVWQDGMEDHTYTVYEGGTYSVQATLPCEVSDQIFIDDCGGSIESVGEHESHAWSLYPNPNSGSFNIQSASNIDLIEVYDSAGRIVYRDHSNQPSGEHQIDLQDTSSGLYLIRVRINGNLEQERLIIER